MTIRKYINTEIWASKTEDDILYGLKNSKPKFTTYVRQIYKLLVFNKKGNWAKSYIYQGKAVIFKLKFGLIKKLGQRDE